MGNVLTFDPVEMEPPMRIYRGRIEPTAKEIVERLLQDQVVEIRTEELQEVQKDLESVLNEYMRMEREINEKSKDLVSKDGMEYSSIGKLRRKLAAEKQFGIDDEALDYIVQQMIEILMSSVHVDEVFAEDHEINRIIAPILKKHMSVDEELEKEVRQKIKHLKDAEGTRSWELEYNRVKSELERLKKLS